MKHKLIAAILALFATTVFAGTGWATWTYTDDYSIAPAIDFSVPTWKFQGPDAAIFPNVSNCSYVTPSAETTIVSPAGSDGQAVRLTNTGGTQGRSHVWINRFDREYTVGEVFTQKIEFDYYHAQKRSQKGKGIPKVGLMYNTTLRGTEQGNVDLPTPISPFIVTNINENWWHLEYFVTSLTPIMTDHGDAPINPNLKINGIRITDTTIFDYSGNTAFVVVDNLRFNPHPPLRLGIFNRYNSWAHGGYYWIKVCWSGEYEYVNMTFSDDSLIEYTPSSKSPFYVYLHAVGVVVITTTMIINGMTYTVDWTLTIT